MINFKLHAVPLLSSLAVGKLVGIIISDKCFLLRIPGKFPTELVANIAKLAECGCPVTCLGVSQRQFAAVDTVQPIFMMILGLAKTYRGLVILD